MYVAFATKGFKMKKKLNIIKTSSLFEGIADTDLESLLQCLGGKFVEYEKKESIFISGNTADVIGLVLDGSVEISRSDLFGNRTILGKLSQGELFGEAFACAGVDILPVDVIAVSNCNILLMNYRRIITTCTSSCIFHNRLIENMLRIIAMKNIYLNGKIEVLSARTIREKLMTYLNSQAVQSKSYSFTIPFNRQDLADYLSVDRSALSREMGAMQSDGLMKVTGNKFLLMKKE